MATFTSFLGLRKPATSDNVNVTLDLADNMDDIDTAIQSLDSRLDTIEGVWTSFTGTPSNFTVSSQRGRYKLLGKTALIQWRGVIATTVGPTMALTLPSPLNAFHSSYNIGLAGDTLGFGSCRDVSVGPNGMLSTIPLNLTGLVAWLVQGNNEVTATNPFTWAAGDVLTFSIVVELA